ncbi:YARHG domain-containing protein [Roseivirga sp. BDSF3-8]|uniref:YARHG domain-containing protein n=1 Tax=Roseivirga sp. BDSF3-8 TaxID=3241598 RepID=UPI0035325F00
MKIISLLLLTLFCTTISTYANDGVYLTSGSVIYPQQETSISLEEEFLSFTVRERRAYVSIRFDFYNPEDTARKLLIGFQAPSAEGDVSDSVSNLNQIEDFTVLQEGQILPYKIKAALCEDCELKDPESVRFTDEEPGIFVYLFEMTFKPGMNRVQHSYNFPASYGIFTAQSYDYILTTGAKWAGGKIGDLTVQIDMGPDTYFYVGDNFGKGALWSVVGTGRLTDSERIFMGLSSSKVAKIRSGSVLIEVKNFKPQHNIHFGEPNRYEFISDYGEQDDTPIGIVKPEELYDIKDWYSKADLRLLRNAIYAHYGYDFNSTELRQYFSQFDWYMPDPNLKMEDIHLTDKEKELIDRIKELEK